MLPELAALLPLLEDARVQEVAGRRLHHGRLQGHEVVLMLCGIGKVASALSTTLLIERAGVRRLLFTGVAGGLGTGVRVGDVVVARSFIQHDLDVSPLFARHVVPDLGVSELHCDDSLTLALAEAARQVLADPGPGLAELGLQGARLHQGLMISGDRFVSTAAESQALRTQLPQALAVEMEGAAMAQVCAAYGVPCGMVRTISDRADDQAHLDFNRFLASVASPMSRAIVLKALASIKD